MTSGGLGRLRDAHKPSLGVGLCSQVATKVCYASVRVWLVLLRRQGGENLPKRSAAKGRSCA